ncbi:MAG: hypothetical protein KKB81_05420 [Candidatus Margulisbacteria bacterium]|nr:hypothetical protein [Candidatus Margulisiibacteriota bacterium]MBU1021300.1 hypothetical protein [Candidatus Margulisiibacteriota bacterium]MBU1729211.1 hypothetical protein [Candidatus Margulisiibacteriota bacterium]MBU1954884.1 hypothetical protein [Candidatus Margulisiibacteriota bacterium]
MLTKKEADDIMKMKGEVRGVVFQTDATYLKIKYGEEGLKKVEENLKQLGYPIEFEKVKAMGWYPMGLRGLSLMVIKDTFNWDDAAVKAMGNMAPKFSFMVKILMRYFISLEQTVKSAPLYWPKHYSAGELVIADYSEEKKYVNIRLEGIKFLPVFCKYIEGYFSRIIQFALPDKEVSSQQIKCSYRGDPYDEYKVSWI